MKAWFLRLHRWTALVFAAPLAIVILTGLALSFEPAITTLSVKPGTVTLAKVETWLARHDPRGEARALSLKPLENRFEIRLPDDDVEIDVASGAVVSDEATTLSDFLGDIRGLHERLVLDLRWLVTASSFAMLALVSLGLLMGWPRISNSLTGWHKAAGWIGLPLVVLSPLTGIFVALGVTFAAPAPRGQGAPPTILEAARLVAANHDLSAMTSLRVRGGRLMARIVEGGEYRAYGVTREGVTPLARNWPRLIHEGNWWGLVSALVNVVTSALLMILMITGVWVWARRKLRRRARRPGSRPAVASP